MTGPKGEVPQGQQGELPYGNVQPISPKDVVVKKAQQIPDVVFETFNSLIAQKIGDGGYARFTLKEIADRLEAQGVNRKEMFDKHWLDIEDIYRKAGWHVEFDRPGFNEDYEANFTFKPKREEK